MNCTNGVEGARARKCFDYRHLVKSYDFQPHMGLPPSCHSKSGAFEGPLSAAPQCLSSHQDFLRFQADRNFFSVLDLSQFFFLVGLYIFYSIIITLMEPLEEEEINKSAQPTKSPCSQENWAFTTRCEAAAFDLSG